MYHILLDKKHIIALQFATQSARVMIGPLGSWCIRNIANWFDVLLATSIGQGVLAVRNGGQNGSKGVKYL